MSNEELLTPRFKVISDYPGSHLEIGTIIPFDYGRLPYDATNNFEKYPAIFKKLEWWDGRKLEDLPEYIMLKSGVNDRYTIVYKRCKIGYVSKELSVRISQLSGTFPCSEQEYNDAVYDNHPE